MLGITTVDIKKIWGRLRQIFVTNMQEKFFKPVVHVLLLTRKLITQCHATVFLRALNLVSLNHRRVTELMDLQPSILVKKNKVWRNKTREFEYKNIQERISNVGWKLIDRTIRGAGQQQRDFKGYEIESRQSCWQ